MSVDGKIKMDAIHQMEDFYEGNLSDDLVFTFPKPDSENLKLIIVHIYCPQSLKLRILIVKIF